MNISILSWLAGLPVNTDHHQQTEENEWKYNNKILLPDLIREWHYEQKDDDTKCQEMAKIPFTCSHSSNVYPDDVQESDKSRPAENPQDKLFQMIAAE